MASVVSVSQIFTNWCCAKAGKAAKIENKKMKRFILIDI
jgi:hypothetical protein